MSENYAAQYDTWIPKEEAQYIETKVRDTPPTSLSLKLIPPHQQKSININTNKVQEKQLQKLQLHQKIKNL